MLFPRSQHDASASRMTDFASLLIADRRQKARVIHLVDKDSFGPWLKARPAEDRVLIEAHRFDGKKGFAFVILPRGPDFEVVSAVKDAASLSPWCLARLGESLPEGTYKLASGEPGKAALGWLLAQHQFDNYRSKKDEPEPGPRVLVTGEPARIDEAVRLADATALVRDLVNTPAADLGPAELEPAVRAGATSERAPRLIELEWGKAGDPRIAVVGKGVCFDSGGLDLKSASGMRLMKKDMGGAAHALALARLIT